MTKRKKTSLDLVRHDLAEAFQQVVLSYVMGDRVEYADLELDLDRFEPLFQDPDQAEEALGVRETAKGFDLTVLGEEFEVVVRQKKKARST